MIGLNADDVRDRPWRSADESRSSAETDATTARRAKIAAMVKEGKTLDEIKAALPDAPAPGAPARGAGPGGAAAGAARGGGAPPPKTFVEIGVRGAHEEIGVTGRALTVQMTST